MPLKLKSNSRVVLSPLTSFRLWITLTTKAPGAPSISRILRNGWESECPDLRMQAASNVIPSIVARQLANRPSCLVNLNRGRHFSKSPSFRQVARSQHRHTGKSSESCAPFIAAFCDERAAPPDQVNPYFQKYVLTACPLRYFPSLPYCRLFLTFPAQ